MFAQALTSRVLAYADQQAIGGEPFYTDIPGLIVARLPADRPLARALPANLVSGAAGCQAIVSG